MDLIQFSFHTFLKQNQPIVSIHHQAQDYFILKSFFNVSKPWPASRWA
jgi:hypothetical protein